MKILWIVNSVLGELSKHLYHKESNGVWMDALLDSFKGQMQHQIIVATTINTKKILKIIDSNIIYYALPDNPPTLYDESKPENIMSWKKIIDEEKPDLIQVWGTEFTHGLCALRVAGNIPSIVYMQGYLGSIARHYLAGISHQEVKKSLTIRDVIKCDSVMQQQKKYYKSSMKEKEMLQLAGRIISENEWCNLSIEAIVPNIKIYTCPLSVNQVFSKAKWNIQTAEPHSIICNASGYPLKGLHMILQAVALLKQRYPDVRLYVPGTRMISDGSAQWKLRKRGYTKHIEKLVNKLNLIENIVWLGHVSQEELTKYYEKARVFVLGSCIENHSSSLKEAMMVGTPSIAAAVGGVPEYVKHGENGLLYRFEEYEIMAKYVERLFEEDEFAIELSDAGRQSMLKLHGGNHIYDRMLDIYYAVLEEKKI